MNPSQKKSLNPLVVVLSVATFFFLIFLIVSAYLFIRRQGQSDWQSGEKPALFGSGGSAVGVVELKGVILDSKKILRQLNRFEENPQVKAVVIRLDSPGGSVAPSQEIYEALKDYPKPVVASMGSVAASGAYYVAMGAKKVFANPGTLTGSIGVIMEFANLEKLYEWAKIKRFAIKTGKFKDTGSEFRTMTPEERAFLQHLIDDVLEQFKKAVREGRSMKRNDVDRVADGRIFSGAQAKSSGLVDSLGTLQDAIDEAAKLGGIDGKPRVIYPSRKLDLIDRLLDQEDDAESFTESFAHKIREFLSGLTVLGGTPFSREMRPPGLYWLWTGSGI